MVVSQLNTLGFRSQGIGSPGSWLHIYAIGTRHRAESPVGGSRQARTRSILRLLACRCSIAYTTPSASRAMTSGTRSRPLRRWVTCRRARSCGHTMRFNARAYANRATMASSSPWVRVPASSARCGGCHWRGAFNSCRDSCKTPTRFPLVWCQAAPTLKSICSLPSV